MDDLTGRLKASLQASLNNYEWRCFLYLFMMTVASGKTAAEVRRKEVETATGIRGAHISRAFSNLEAKGVIGRITYKGITTYHIRFDQSDDWRASPAAGPIEASGETRAAWEKWWERYPQKIYRRDAMELFFKLVRNGVEAVELEEALTGYINFMLWRSEKFGRDPEEAFCLYPTTFLRGRWEEFRKYANMKRKPKL